MNESKLKQSFTASLKILGQPSSSDYWSGLSADSRLMVIEDDYASGGLDMAGAGWLVKEFDADFSKASDVTLRFELLDEATQQFRISCQSPKSYAGKRLDTSRNGYLGFYGNTGDHVAWALKIISGQPGEGMVIQIADHKGNDVKHVDKGYVGTRGSNPAFSFEVKDYRAL
ncbi:hypothetical protein F3J45_09355 [Pantoea sp. Ap-967]|uniref:hypothetical protein n=1 Tax=Pantoea sp. Ap-967 TaxID=2608362 RepID=UPI001420973C|nr:hypothetical protein [Pantoea sp. Ap-967]NIE74640.1 hypothetical protein [Pantoea sp. Ap-967]